MPCSAQHSRNVRATSPSVTEAVTRDRSIMREWSSSQAGICASVPSASGQCVESDCHVSLGSSASNLAYGLRGRFLGSASTRPMSWRMRWIVETDGARSMRSPSTPWMLRAPQSQPPASRRSRTCTIRARTLPLVRLCTLRGLRERGSSPGSPGSPWRARSLWIHWRVTP